jgi:hypothetical protein
MRLILFIVIVSALILVANLAERTGTDFDETTHTGNSSNSARVVFYSPTGNVIDMLGEPAIFINGAVWARLIRGRYFYITVPPGSLTACIGLPDYDCHTIHLLPGNVYYFKATYDPLGYRLSRVDALNGEADRFHNAQLPIPQRLIKNGVVQIDLK